MNITAIATSLIGCAALYVTPLAMQAQQQPPPPATPPTSSPQPTATKDSLDKLVTAKAQAKMGWNKLTPDEREATAAFITAERDTVSEMHARIRRDQSVDERDAAADGWDSTTATEYLEQSGWKRCQCAIVTVGGREHFVVKETWRQYATADVPFGLSAHGLRSARPNGEFWCKTKMMGGVSAVIVSGRKHSFPLSADWMELK